MIDTITIVIPRYEQYELLFKQFTNQRSTSWTEFETRPAEFLDTDGTINNNGNLESLEKALRNVNAPFEADMLRFRVYNDAVNFVPVIHASDIKVPSYDYKVNIFISLSEMKLEFSIPKYVFGTNLFQVLPFNYDWGECYWLLMNFLRGFFSRHCVVVPDFYDIEIRRIDLCYNQFFINETDCLAYLEQQKSLARDYSRQNGRGYAIYPTSINYVSSYYTFKIYWKGQEFAKHDYKRLDVENARYDVVQLQSDANRMLRYEIGFRKSFFNNLVREYVFENNQKHYNQGIAKLQNKVSRFFQKLPADLRLKFSGKSRAFTLRSDWDLTEDASILYSSDSWPFSKDLFVMLSHYFLENVYKYQFATMPLLEDIVKRIDKKNEENLTMQQIKKRGNHQRSRCRLILAAEFLRNHTFAELKTIIPKNTLSQLKADLKDLGLSNLTKELHIPVPKIDYTDYGLFCQLHNRPFYNTF